MTHMVDDLNHDPTGDPTDEHEPGEEEGEDEASEETLESDSQPRYGYLCACGFHTDADDDAAQKAFRTHLMTGGNRDGKGVHKSLGKVNFSSGDTIQPPVRDMDPQRLKKYKDDIAVRKGRKKPKEQRQPSMFQQDEYGEPIPGGARRLPSPVPTKDPKDASFLYMVPRSFTCDFTPIMRSAMDAAMREWGWPAMSLADFLDTCLFHFFIDRGIELGGYVVTNGGRAAIARAVEQAGVAQGGDNGRQEREYPESYSEGT